MKTKIWIVLILLITAVFLTACNAAEGGTDGEDTMSDMDHEHDDDHEEMDHAVMDRVPNEGAVIKILAPADGETFAAGEEIMVEIETEQVAVGVDGYHWHIYIDGASWGMIMGQNSTQVLRGVEPGMHKIEVYLSNEAHEELADGDGIMVEVSE